MPQPAGEGPWSIRRIWVALALPCTREQHPNNFAGFHRFDEVGLLMATGGTMLRILISTNDDLFRLDDAAESHGYVRWIVPKDSQPGEVCLFSHMGEGVTHMGELKSNATRNDEPPWQGKYSARVYRISVLADPVSHEELVEDFPDWKWPTYPKSYTSVDGALARDLLDLCSDRTAPSPHDIDQVVAMEGTGHIRRHLVRERDLSIIAAKRDEVLSTTGRLACEICGFDFLETYGDLGREFCEVHHLLPMASRYEETETRLQDLAVVCSNCHRMLHRRGLRSIKELQNIVRARGGKPAH